MSDKEEARARARELAAEFGEGGRPLEWFEAFYKEAQGDTELIPWADLEPNAYFKKWVDANGLDGGGRTALVIGCGLGDDAKYLHDLGFKVTAFDISPTAIEWAGRLYGSEDIQFEVADLFQPFRGWLGAFDLVLEIYTIQPLPIEMRPQVLDSIASFVAPGGTLIVVTRGRDDDQEPEEMPWPVSRRDLSRFEENGLRQTGVVEMPAEDPDEPPRFVVTYKRVSAGV